MSRRSTFRLTVILAVAGLVLAATGLRAQDNTRWTRKYKTPPQSARIEVTILKADSGKPIENAAVIFHPIEGDHDKGALEMKSDEDGKAIIDVIPIGDTVRLQVIASGFQTYGQDYKVDKDALTVEVRMKRPGQQYSLYKEKGAKADSGSGKPANPSANPPATPSKDAAAPPATSGKPSSSGSSNSQSGSQSSSQSSAQPDQDQAQSK